MGCDGVGCGEAFGQATSGGTSQSSKGQSSPSRIQFTLCLLSAVGFAIDGLLSQAYGPVINV